MSVHVLRSVAFGIAALACIALGDSMAVDAQAGDQRPAQPSTAGAGGAPAPATPQPPAGRGNNPATYGGRNLAPPNFSDNTGFVQIFNGKTLSNWDGDPAMWSVRDESIYAESSEDRPAGRTFIIWRGGEPANFELKFESKWVGPGNGGFQIRGRVVPYSVGTAVGRAGGQAQPGRAGAPTPSGAAALIRAEREKWNIAGYQLNISNIDVGSMYEISTGRAFLTGMGRVNRLEQGKPPTTLAMLKSYDELFTKFAKDDWNQYHIVANGNVIAYIVNGELFSLTIDDDYGRQAMKGLIAIEIETRGASQVWTKNLWLRNLP
jgi:hypothetical protein